MCDYCGSEYVPVCECGREYVNTPDELTTLRKEQEALIAENERLWEALVRLSRLGDKTPVDIGLVALIAKEALK